MGNHSCNILCYANSAMLMSYNEDNFQIIPHKFMVLLVRQTKRLTMYSWRRDES